MQIFIKNAKGKKDRYVNLSPVLLDILLMKQNLLISFFLLITICCFGQKRTQLLSKAYQTKSIQLLDTFFRNWIIETKALSIESFNSLNDKTKEVYNVFQVFYNPKDLDKIGGSECGNDLYKNAKYLVIQNQVIYEIGDSITVASNDTLNYINYITTKDNSAFPTDTLKNFRPNINLDSSKTVVLTKDYDDLLNYFLGSKHTKLGIGNIMAPAKSSGESKKRQEFLEKFIKIFYGHWGSYWQLYSYPTVQKIRFDNSFTNAIVYYRMVYEGGEAYLKKINSKWTLIKAERTWIE